MKLRVEVKTQAEFDAVIRAGNIAVCLSGRFQIGFNASAELCGNASAELWGNASAVLCGNASAELWENASAVLWGNASAVLWENASAVLWENASAELCGNASAVLWGNASAELWENASAVLWGNASAVLWENASAEAFGNVFLRVFSALKITAAASVCIMLHGSVKHLKGGKRIKAVKPNTPKDWCLFWGVEVKKSVAILFKAVTKDFKSNRDFPYVPGTQPEAPDWDGGKQECGGGLHFSPHPVMGLEFHSSATKFVACPVALKDIVMHSDGSYPQKVKAKRACAPVYEVDRNGKKIEPKPKGQKP